MKRGLLFVLVTLFAVSISHGAYQVINVGVGDDSTYTGQPSGEMHRMITDWGDWGAQTTFQGRPCRFMKDATSPMFALTLPPNGGTVKLTIYCDNTTYTTRTGAWARCWIQNWDGDAWEDERLGHVQLDVTNSWATYYIPVPAECYGWMTTVYYDTTGAYSGGSEIGTPWVDDNANLADGMQARFQFGDYRSFPSNVPPVPINTIEFLDSKIWVNNIGLLRDNDTRQCLYLNTASTGWNDGINVSQWSGRAVVNGQLCRVTLGTGTADCNPFIATIDPDITYLMIKYLDDAAQAPGFAIYCDYALGGSSADLLIDNVPITGSGTWKTRLIPLATSTILTNASDFRPGHCTVPWDTQNAIPGKQVVLRLTNIGGGMLTKQIAIAGFGVGNSAPIPVELIDFSSE